MLAEGLVRCRGAGARRGDRGCGARRDRGGDRAQAARHRRSGAAGRGATASAERGATTTIRARPAMCRRHLYSYSFARRSTWSRLCSPRDEILDYVERVADVFGVDAARAHQDQGERVRVGRRGTALGGAYRGRRRAARGRGGAGDRTAQPARVSHDRGHGHVRRAQFPLRALGARLRPERQAGRGDRHRRERGAVRAAGRGAGRAADRFPAHRQLDPAAPQQRLPPVDRRVVPAVPDAGRGVAADVVLLPGTADRADPASAHARPGRPALVGAVHARAAARPARSAARRGRTIRSAASACCSARRSCPRCNGRTSSW